ncbi:MAG: aldehyde ferredoxin oxidoreductase family protein [Candidatus Thorarchaeota archaeon]
MIRYGWTGKILWVNLTTQTSKTEEISSEILEDYIGGKGLGAYLLYKYLEPKIDPLGPENILFFMTGPLQGLPAPNVGRWTLVTKSPLTGGFLDTHCGGPLGREIKNAGYDVVAVTGKSKHPVVLVIEDDKVQFDNAENYWGKGTHESTKLLHAQYSDDSAVYVIGPAGENLVLSATGCCELAHQTGRGGAGAVLGSKHFKGIVVKGTGKHSPKDPDALREINKMAAKLWKENEASEFKRFGTASLVEVANERSQFPTRNWRNGFFEDYENLLPETYQHLNTGAHLSCPNCILRCTHAYKIEDPSNPGSEVESTVEYETLGLCGGNLGISDPVAVLRLNFLADDLGLDTISGGSAIGFAMDLFENGILTEDEIGFPIRFGDSEAALKLMRKIAYRDGIGDTLAKGVRLAAEEIGKGSEEFAAHVKGMEFAAWDPRGKKGLGLSYASSAVGASHLRGWPQTTEKPDSSALDVIESMVTERDTKHLTDSMIVCHFTWNFPLTREHKVTLVNGATGSNYDSDSISRFGQRVDTLTRLFNIREGFSRKDDTIPPKFWIAQTTGNAKGRKAFVTKDDFERSLDKYYELRGWTSNGVPTQKTIDDLALTKLVNK